jgi:hypothetical protein
MALPWEEEHVQMEDAGVGEYLRAVQVQAAAVTKPRRRQEGRRPLSSQEAAIRSSRARQAAKGALRAAAGEAAARGAALTLLPTC